MGCYSRHCRMSEASQSKPTPVIRTGSIINLPGMEWECGEASSIYTRTAPAKVNVVAQIREIIRLMKPASYAGKKLQQKGRRPKPTPHRTETKKAEADQAEGRGFGHKAGPTAMLPILLPNLTASARLVSLSP